MVSAAFDYLAVHSYDEAVQQLVEHGDEAKIIAGGQSLVPMLNLRLARPARLIDINGADQREPAFESDTLRLPALTRHRTLLEHPLVRAHCPLLADAIRHVGNVRVRNRGTIGGSLAHGDPTGEISSCGLVLDARAVARGPAGERTIPLRDLFVTYLTTALAEAEVITDVLIPATRPRQGWSFHEMVRRTSDFAIVAVAARIDLDERADVVAAAHLAMAGVADRVMLARPELLAGLAGRAPGAATIAQVAAEIADSVEPGDDVHASAGYRRRLVRVLSARALRDAFDNARGAAA
ncbi:MAG TPA: xanthine dehydrogenase family protein subunit M [Streptosporangiaceae bacterium]|nr:xanthine dehydrogenase family protein subunit M [Streptosporangiaceae bacterium]